MATSIVKGVNEKLKHDEQYWLQVLRSTPSNCQEDPSTSKNFEEALLNLGRLAKSKNATGALAELITASRPKLDKLPLAKASKIVKTLMDYLNEIPGSVDTLIKVTKESIEWAREGRRAFLVQSFQIRLAGLYIESNQHHQALSLISELLKSLKKLDDKTLLVDVYLLESRAFHAIRNISKSRAALTSARTNANAIYINPAVQAGLDMQSAILHSDDLDFKIAYSYFYEAFENYRQVKHTRTIFALKYMILSLIMMNNMDELNQLLTGSSIQQFQSKEIEAMKAIAKAQETRSLAKLEKAFQTYKDELQSDKIIRTHFTALYDNMLEHNILKVVEPFSRIEIQHIADILGLPIEQIEGKLSQMILDKVFYGVLDQGVGCLDVFPKPKQDKLYESALEVIQNVNNIVDLLVEKKAAKLV